MKKLFCSLLVLATFAALGQAEIAFVKEELRVQSKVLDEERLLTVYRPEKINGPLSTIYLFDGEWNLEATAGIIDLFVRWARIPMQVAVVAVHNQGTRTKDLTPVVDDQRFPGSGGGFEFLSFVTEELIPSIEEQVGESADRLLVGHSFGGLFALFALLEQPDYFDGCIAISPSTWFGNNYLSNDTNKERLQQFQEQKLVFITTGEYDRGNGASNQAYVKWLEAQAPEVGLDVRYRQYEGRNHFSNVLPSIDEGLSAYFPGPEVKEEMVIAYEEGGIDQLKLWYETKVKTWGQRFVAPTGAILEYTGGLYTAKKYEKALEILKWYEPYAPENGNVYYYVGTISEELGALDQAEAYYRRALEMKLPDRVKTVIQRKLDGLTNASSK